MNGDDARCDCLRRAQFNVSETDSGVIVVASTKWRGKQKLPALWAS